MTETTKTYEYQATVHRVIDGDTVYLKLSRTFTLDVDFGFRIQDSIEFTKTTVQDFRLAGINAPEITGENKIKGLEAKAELARILALGPIRVVSTGQDKYGRWLAVLYVTLPDNTEINVNETMIKEGYAAVYNP
jgi:endonuclease YncB( thermonuclease family)